jgi:hypothetical protein
MSSEKTSGLIPISMAISAEPFSCFQSFSMTLVAEIPLILMPGAFIQTGGKTSRMDVMVIPSAGILILVTPGADRVSRIVTGSA